MFTSMYDVRRSQCLFRIASFSKVFWSNRNKSINLNNNNQNQKNENRM